MNDWLRKPTRSGGRDTRWPVMRMAAALTIRGQMSARQTLCGRNRGGSEGRECRGASQLLQPIGRLLFDLSALLHRPLFVVDLPPGNPPVRISSQATCGSHSDACRPSSMRRSRTSRWFVIALVSRTYASTTALQYISGDSSTQQIGIVYTAVCPTKVRVAHVTG
jgi:hypothetical protein